MFSIRFSVAIVAIVLLSQLHGCSSTTSKEESGTMYATAEKEAAPQPVATNTTEISTESTTMLASNSDSTSAVTMRTTLATTDNTTSTSQEELDKQLWDAARNGNSTIVNQLLQQGANPNIATSSGETALHASTAANSFQTAILLVNAGADINVTTANGWSPLHHAARFGSAEIANYLLQQGVDANAVTNDNKTPLQMALDQGDLRTARILGY